MPRKLRNLKELNTASVYGDNLMVLWGHILCFAWRDNHRVLGMTTAYSLHRPKEDFMVDKWRSKETSTDNHIAKSVFAE
ncbi:hypothetical protein FOPE_00900 [Fonsecaea pedrosoi]|nr:hypothetical protein FOPE_00900 [Fonsecaea pedrosoi]